MNLLDDMIREPKSLNKKGRLGLNITHMLIFIILGLIFGVACGLAFDKFLRTKKKGVWDE